MEVCDRSVPRLAPAPGDSFNRSGNPVKSAFDGFTFTERIR